MNKNSVIHLLISTDSLKKYDWNSYIIKVISSRRACAVLLEINESQHLRRAFPRQ